MTCFWTPACQWDPFAMTNPRMHWCHANERLANPQVRRHSWPNFVVLFLRHFRSYLPNGVKFGKAQGPCCRPYMMDVSLHSIYSFEQAGRMHQNAKHLNNVRKIILEGTACLIDVTLAFCIQCYFVPVLRESCCDDSEYSLLVLYQYSYSGTQLCILHLRSEEHRNWRTRVAKT